MRLWLSILASLLVTQWAFSEEEKNLACECAHHEDQVAVRKSWQALTATTDAQTSVRLDVVAYYTDEARRRRQQQNRPSLPSTGSEGIREHILQSIAVANETMENSDVPHRFRLMAILETDYVNDTEGSLTIPLRAMNSATDGVLDDEIRIATEEYGADCVTLFVSSNRFGGLANVLSPGVSLKAFSVVRAMNSTDTLMHELGHNLGLRHARSTYSSPPRAWTSTAFARLFTGNDGQRYGTVMNSLNTTNAERAIRAPVLASPHVRWEGVVTGVSGSEDTRAAVLASAPFVAAVSEPRSIGNGEITRISPTIRVELLYQRKKLTGKIREEMWREAEAELLCDASIPKKRQRRHRVRDQVDITREFLELVLDAFPNQFYRLERSEDLHNWSLVSGLNSVRTDFLGQANLSVLVRQEDRFYRWVLALDVPPN